VNLDDRAEYFKFPIMLEVGSRSVTAGWLRLARINADNCLLEVNHEEFNSWADLITDKWRKDEGNKSLPSRANLVKKCRERCQTVSEVVVKRLRELGFIDDD
jgi:hypothetical protein